MVDITVSNNRQRRKLKINILRERKFDLPE